MNDRWNPWLWLRAWLLKPSHMASRKISTAAKGEPEATACSQTISVDNELCPAWSDACDALSVSDNALASRITSIHRCPEAC